MNWLDRAIGAVAPARAVTRLKARQQLAGMTARNEYEGASQGRRAFSWKRRTTDANAELSPTTMQLLRGIARDLVRNNSFASRRVGGIAEAVIGTGITYRVMRNGKLDQAMTDLARQHFDSTACDAEGRHDFYGLQLQAMRAIVESGSVLMRRRWRRKSDGLPVPFCMQLLEPDYINMQLTTPLPGGGYRIAGIDFDGIGRRVAYQMYAGHPG
ncbi:MAG: phage portal protein, partial [Janthinobacterium lividum]